MSADMMFYVTMGMSGAMVLCLAAVQVRWARDANPNDWADGLFPLVGAGLGLAIVPWIMWICALEDPVSSMLGGVVLCAACVILTPILGGILLGLLLAGLAAFAAWFFEMNDA